MSTLFDPIQAGDLHLSNRIAMAPLTRNRSPRTVPGELTATYYAQRASAGLLVSEGTPISPVLESPEALARWLADNNASAFGYQTATYEQWLATCLSGSAPSAIFSARTGLVSGVEYMAEMEASR